MSAHGEPIFVLSERDRGFSGADAGSSRSALTGARRFWLLIFLVAYHAESTVGPVLTRIPDVIAQEHDVEVLVIDDASTDETVKRAVDTRLAFPMTVL